MRRFERQLTDNGYLVMKFFLHISKKEQTRRMERLTDEKDTVWRVGKRICGRTVTTRSAWMRFLPI